MIDLENLKSLELDALKEASNIGCSHAATAVSKMINKKIDISVPDVFITKVEDLGKSLSRFIDESEKAAGVYLELTEEFSGSIIHIFPIKSACSLTSALMGKTECDTTQIGEIEKSALMEVGNIVVSAYANALGDFVDARVLLTPPQFKFDLPGSVVDDVIKTIGGDTKNAIVFDTQMKEANSLFSSFFVLLPTQKSMEVIIEKLFKKI